MRFRTGLVVGLGVGYYFGAKAGRERYEQIEEWLDRLRDTAAYRDVRTKVEDGIREGTTALRTMVEETAFGGDRQPPLDLDDDAVYLGDALDADRPGGGVRSLFTDPTLN
jgi:hypothetical protein